MIAPISKAAMSAPTLMTITITIVSVDHPLLLLLSSAISVVLLVLVGAVEAEVVVKTPEVVVKTPEVVVVVAVDGLGVCVGITVDCVDVGITDAPDAVVCTIVGCTGMPPHATVTPLVSVYDTFSPAVVIKRVNVTRLHAEGLLEIGMFPGSSKQSPS